MLIFRVWSNLISSNFAFITLIFAFIIIQYSWFGIRDLSTCDSSIDIIKVAVEPVYSGCKQLQNQHKLVRYRAVAGELLCCCLAWNEFGRLPGFCWKLIIIVSRFPFVQILGFSFDIFVFQPSRWLIFCLEHFSNERKSDFSEWAFQIIAHHLRVMLPWLHFIRFSAWGFVNICLLWLSNIELALCQYLRERQPSLNKKRSIARLSIRVWRSMLLFRQWLILAAWVIRLAWRHPENQSKPVLTGWLQFCVPIYNEGTSPCFSFSPSSNSASWSFINLSR